MEEERYNSLVLPTTSNKGKGMTDERFKSLVLYILIGQSICILLITVFCIAATVYGYPLANAGTELVNGGAEKWKTSLIDEVKVLVENVTQNLSRVLAEDMSRVMGEQLAGYEGLTTLDVTGLNLAISRFG